MGGDGGDGADPTPDVIEVSMAAVLASRRRWVDTLPVRYRMALQSFDFLLGWPPAPAPAAEAPSHTRWDDIRSRHIDALDRTARRHALDPEELAHTAQAADERRAYLGARGEAADERVRVDYAWHGVDASVIEETCRDCGAPATHKIGDQSAPASFHELTSWVCCRCMRRLGMDCALYPPH